MVNNDRIVPITKIDWLSAISTVLALIGISHTIWGASTIDGAFSVTGDGDVGVILANQPVQSLDFQEGVTAGTVYFVPAFNYAGMTIAGKEPESTWTVEPDGVTLYKAVLAGGDVEITHVSPITV